MIARKLILSFVFLVYASAYLLSYGGEVSDSNALQLYKRDNISIGFEVSNYLYKEPGEMKLTGTKCGLCGEYYVAPSKESNIFRAVQFRFMTGKVDYDGALQFMDGRRKTKYQYSGIPDLYCELRPLLGLMIRGSNTNVKWFPFLGIGFRYLFNESIVMPKGGYNRGSMYWYLPIGMTYKRYCKEGLSFDICGEVDWMLYGEQTSGFIPIVGIIRNIQKNGYGLRLSGKISKEIKDKNAEFFAGPFIRYWNIPESDRDRGCYEPKNYTLELGIQVGYLFK